MRATFRLTQHLPAMDHGPIEPSLSESSAASNPLDLLTAWLADARAAHVPMPNAMILATASADGTPSARTVLLASLDERGLVFHTDLHSPKAHDLSANPRAAAVFVWPGLQRQVRVVGRVVTASHQESLDYFNALELDIRLMIWACRQSAVIDSRADLEVSLAHARETFPDGNVPLPTHWGGLRLVPDNVEFFQGREHWLQDRLRYVRADRSWRIERLAP